MKSKKVKISVAAMALTGALFCSPSTFADNNFGINYTGGEPLGANNVQIKPTFVNSLTPLLEVEAVDVTVDNYYEWRTGYINDVAALGCEEFYYFTVPDGGIKFQTTGGKGYSGANRHVTFSNNQFRTELDILGIGLEGVDPESSIPVGVAQGTSYIYVGWKVYSEDTCTEPIDGLTQLRNTDDSKVFVGMNATLYEKDSTTPYQAKGLYFGLTDIDAGQSYKIISEDSLLKTSNMYAKSAEALQSQDPEVPFRNMFVSSDNYIYSEYSSGAWLGITRDSDIYVTLGQESQEHGVDFVFGFVGAAGSGIEYYAVPFDIQYDADENGSITGINDEKVFPNRNPNGSSYQAKTKYIFSHWIADVDVTLEDGTIIKAGNPITDAQIKQVVVDKDIKFTAIFEVESPAVPNTGASTSSSNAVQIVTSVFGVLIGALIIRSLPRLSRRKINFDK